MAKRESSRSATLEIGSVVDATTAGEAAVESCMGVTLKLIHHVVRLQGNGTTLSEMVTSRR